MVSGQLGQTSSELPFTQKFFGGPITFFFTDSLEYFFLLQFPYAVSNLLSISIVTQ